MPLSPDSLASPHEPPQGCDDVIATLEKSTRGYNGPVPMLRVRFHESLPEAFTFCLHPFFADILSFSYWLWKDLVSLCHLESIFRLSFFIAGSRN